MYIYMYMFAYIYTHLLIACDIITYFFAMVTSKPKPIARNPAQGHFRLSVSGFTMHFRVRVFRLMNLGLGLSVKGFGGSLEFWGLSFLYPEPDTLLTTTTKTLQNNHV